MVDQEEDTTELDKEYKAKVWEVIQRKPFPMILKKMVFCADTIGQDRSLTEAECSELEEYSKHFGNS